MIRITLIISTYNRPRALQLTLESVLRQSQMPDEIIIADDGSTKETAEVIKIYRTKFEVPLVHCFHDDEGFRLAAIRNKAIALSTSEYIVSIDGDLILHKQFVKDHLRLAESGCFVQGSRVLLSEELTRKIESAEVFPKLKFFSKGITNRLNAICSPVLSDWFGKKQKLVDHMRGVRGCNMAFWRCDFLDVNGFNEDFTGWGREDSELVVRFRNYGLQRKNLKFGGVALHLYHPERSRKALPKNDVVLEKTIRQNLLRCENGISKYLK